MSPSAKAAFEHSRRAVGPYRLVRTLGRGGLGLVFLAVDDRSGERVALKLLERAHADPVARRRLEREYRELREVNHPNVVRVLELGVDKGTPYLVMEYVPGVPLRAWLDGVVGPEPPTEETEQGETPAWASGEVDTGDLPRPRPARAGPELEALNQPDRVRRLAHVARQLAAGLGHIHGLGLVHRDVKPPNILVDGRGRCKLLDFGLVKSLLHDSKVTQAGSIVGTYLYMSPEQAMSGSVDGRSDLYSLGAVLYEMLTGTPPLHARTVGDLIEEIARRPVEPVLALNPGADAKLAAVAERLLAKDPGARFQTAADVAAALEGA